MLSVSDASSWWWHVSAGAAEHQDHQAVCLGGALQRTEHTSAQSEADPGAFTCPGSGPAHIRWHVQVLQGIKTIKLFAWEEPFGAEITRLRNLELALVRRAGFLEAFSSMIYDAVSLCSAFSCCSAGSTANRRYTECVVLRSRPSLL